MSGHSHWHGIKHKKEAADAKRSKIFSKIARAISVAVQNAGTDSDTNFALRLALDQARAANMPKDNIERTIKKASGEDKDALRMEEVVYEGYGPGNAAMLICTVTDNTNRTVSEVKSLLTKNGGKFVPQGSVSFQFDRVGIVVFERKHHSDDVELALIEAGAIDIRTEDDFTIVITAPEKLQETQQALEALSVPTEDARLSYVAQQPLELSDADRTSYDKLREIVEDHDDVQEVVDNVA